MKRSPPNLLDIIITTIRYREASEDVLYLHGAAQRVYASFDRGAHYTDPMVLDWLEERLFVEEELTWEVGHA